MARRRDLWLGLSCKKLRLGLPPNPPRSGGLNYKGNSLLIMGKRRFAGGNPFVSRKKYKGKKFAPKPKYDDKKVAVAKVSGAALGAILGNVRGAIMGYNAGGAAAKWATKKKKLSIKKAVSRPVSSHNDLTVHNLGSISMNKYPKKPETNVKAVVVNQSNFVINGNLAAMGVDGTVQGLQGVDYLDEICHRDWFISNISPNRFVRRSLATDLYKFSKDNGVAWTGYGAEVARSYSDQSIYIDYIDVEYGLLSMTTVPQLVDIYLCSPRTDIPENPLDKFKVATQYEGNGQRFSTNAFNTTINDVNDGKFDLGGANPSGIHQWGKNPLGLQEFRRAFNCVKKISLTLNPGDQRHYKLRIYYKRKIDAITFTNFRTVDHLKGLTITPLVVARAGLVGIKTPEGTESAEVSYGKAKVGITTNMKIVMKACLQPRLQPMERIHQGIQWGTTDVVREIDDEDNVKDVEMN